MIVSIDMKKYNFDNCSFVKHLPDNVKHSMLDFIQKIGLSINDLFRLHIICVPKNSEISKYYITSNCIIVNPVNNVGAFIPCTINGNIRSLYKFEPNKIYDLKFVLFCILASSTYGYTIKCNSKPIITPFLYGCGNKQSLQDCHHPIMERFLYSVAIYVKNQSERLSYQFNPSITHSETCMERYERLLRDESKLFSIGYRLDEIRKCFSPRKVYFKHLVSSKRYENNKQQVGYLIDEIYIEF